MDDPVSQKPYRSKMVNTDSIKPGDLVVGSERNELMIAPPGLYVSKVYEEENRASPNYGCTLVVWAVNPTGFEAFNPYYSWYVDNRCVDCDEPWNESHICSKSKEKNNGEGQDTEEG